LKWSRELKTGFLRAFGKGEGVVREPGEKEYQGGEGGLKKEGGRKRGKKSINPKPGRSRVKGEMNRRN